MQDVKLPFVSAIVPVFNDVARLQICLEALTQQTYLQSAYEIVVIDNGSDLTQDVTTIIGGYQGAIVAVESHPGSYAARNLGISIAKGSILAFTDADCIPSANWLEAGVESLLTAPDCCGLVAGRVDTFARDPERPTAVELYDCLTAIPQQEFLRKYQFGATANLFTFRSVIDRVGRFDPNLKSSGDLEWGQRVAAAGYCQVYAATACVAHPARSSFRDLHQRTTRIAGGQYDLIACSNSYLQQDWLFLQSLIRDAIPPLMYIATLWRDKRVSGWKQRLDLAIVIVFVRYVSAWEKVRLKLGGRSTRA
jgi:glycosyltransferase involved in cell wall biosynthesis